MLRQAAQYTSTFPRCKAYEYLPMDDIVHNIEESELPSSTFNAVSTSPLEHHAGR